MNRSGKNHQWVQLEKYSFDGVPYWKCVNCGVRLYADKVPIVLGNVIYTEYRTVDNTKIHADCKLQLILEILKV